MAPNNQQGQAEGAGGSESADRSELRGVAAGAEAGDLSAEAVATGGAEADSEATPRRKPSRSTATKIRHRGGVRTMKTYVLTESDLAMLGTLRLAAMASFSLSTLAFGFWLSITQAFGFTENIAPVVQATWVTWQKVSIGMAIILAIVGSLLLWKGHTYLNMVKREMEHDD